MRIFISHIHEESKLALVLKDWIESTFAGQCDVFVSSDADDIPAGSKWLNQINSALGDSKIFITICSANSIIRPWINFETGCAWIKQIAVIPICHSGLIKSNLPLPLSMFQALDLEEEGFPRLLFNALAKHLGVVKVPRIASGEMISELKNALSLINSKIPSEPRHDIPTGPPRLPEIQEKILQLLAELGGAPAPQMTDIADNFEMHAEEILYHLDKLVDNYYVHSHVIMDEPTTYSLDKRGRAYLVEHELI